MAKSRRITKRKPRFSVAAGRVRKPNPFRSRSLRNQNKLEMVKVASTLPAAIDLPSEEGNLNSISSVDDADFLPDDIESMQSEGENKIRKRMAAAIKLLGFVETCCENNDFDVESPVFFSQVLVRHRIRALKSSDQENNDVCGKCSICGGPMSD